MLKKNACMDILLENATSYEEKMNIYALNEAEQAVINDKMIGNIYQSALKKRDINFDTIPLSKGDIKKFDGYDNMMTTIDMLRQLSKKFGIKISELDIVETAIGNIRAYRKTFEDAFTFNNDFLTLYYNSLVYACVESVSLILASYVEYVKTINALEFKLKKGKGMYGNVCIGNLRKFNNTVKSGEFAKFSKNILSKNKQQFLGTGIAATTALGLALAIVPILRQLIYYFYESRMSVSQYLEQQAEFLRINQEQMNTEGMSPAEKNKVIKNQKETADKLDKLADKIKVNSKISDKNTETKLKQDNKQWTLKTVSGNDDGYMFV